MADRYLHPRVAELVDAIARRPASHAEDRIRRDGRRFYKDAKKARLAQLLREEARASASGGVCVDARRKLTNLASAEASRKKKQFIQERSFLALRRKAAAELSLVRAICTLVAANERQRRENVRISGALAKAAGGALPCAGAIAVSPLADGRMCGGGMEAETETVAEGDMFARAMEGFVCHPAIGEGVRGEEEYVKQEGIGGEQGVGHAGEHGIVMEAGEEARRQAGMLPPAAQVDDFSSVSSDKFLEMD